MKTITSPTRCPACSGALQPRVMVCQPCELRVEGNFELNEFATLPAEDLHFLRIFLHCDGRIRDMESALGLSYPTIKTRMAELKKRVFPAEVPASPAPTPAPAGESPAGVLDRLSRGELSFEQAMSLLNSGEKK